MNALNRIARELLNLFVDDGALALAIVIVVMAAAALAFALPALPLLAGAVLLFGMVGLLLISVWRAAA